MGVYGKLSDTKYRVDRFFPRTGENGRAIKYHTNKTTLCLRYKIYPCESDRSLQCFGSNVGDVEISPLFAPSHFRDQAQYLAPCLKLEILINTHFLDFSFHVFDIQLVQV